MKVLALLLAVTLAWDADPDVIAYRVQVDDQPEAIVSTAEAVIELTKGAHRATVRAVDSRGISSLPSDELLISVQEVTLTIETSPDLAEWEPVHTQKFLTTDPQSFFRLRITTD